MSERLPYEQQLQQQWNDLPLPDENRAWADMKRRLEEDDDDGIIAWWRRGCVLWGMLLLLLTGVGWWILQPQEWFSNKTQTTDIATKQKNIPQQPNINNKPGTPTDTPSSGQPGINGSTTTNTTTPVIPGQQKDMSSQPTDPERTGEGKHNNKTVGSITATNSTATNTFGRSPTRSLAGRAKDPATVSFATQHRKTTGRIKNMQTASKTRAVKETTTITDPAQHPDQVPAVSGTTSADTLVKIKDKPVTALPDTSVAITKTDTAEQSEDPPPPATVKKDSTKKKTFFFSAGVAMHQQLPLDGQNATPYNSLGRKGTLADYIPAVYFRFNKTGKWFIQSEFRYGAPQYTKEFEYKQTKTSTGPITDSTSYKLEKTYYHQLPVTFNYYVLKNWSLGAGLTWNKFSSAVSRVEFHRVNNIFRQDSLISTQILKNKDDSIFAKSYFQAVLETHYQWKRFSLGARYAFGLQPYIKFPLPSGAIKKEKNSSLQVFLRYELWRSKEK